MVGHVCAEKEKESWFVHSSDASKCSISTRNASGKDLITCKYNLARLYINAPFD
jgi:hypothetical protein